MRMSDWSSDLCSSDLPAVVREAALLARSGREKAAAGLIERSWERAPHRDLLAAYLALSPADEDPLARVKRLERLHRLQPDHPDSLTALAEAELAARLWGTARSHPLKRSEERRVGKASVSSCKSRESPDQ